MNYQSYQEWKSRRKLIVKKWWERQDDGYWESQVLISTEIGLLLGQRYKSDLRNTDVDLNSIENSVPMHTSAY